MHAHAAGHDRFGNVRVDPDAPELSAHRSVHRAATHQRNLVLLDEPLQDLAYPLASCWKNDGFTYRGCYQAMTLEGPEWRMVGWKRDARGGVNVGLACGPDYRDVLTISFEPEVKAIWRGSACCDVDSVGAWRELSATNEVAIAHVGPGHRDTCLQAR